MKVLTDSMTSSKSKREEDYQENTDMREKITSAIDKYKDIEEDYKKKMMEHNTNISEMQERLQK